MVLINNAEVLSKLRSYHPGNRMPLLCAVYRSFGRRIISENNEYEKGIRSEVYDINTGGGSENYLTCIALSEEGITAIGSGNKEGSLYFVKDRSAIKDIESGTRFKPLHKEMLGSPIHSLDWSGNKLLVGLNNGTTNLYKIEFNQDVLEGFTLVGQYINSPTEIQMHAPFYISNTHVKSTEFSPNYDSSAEPVGNTFLSTTQNLISVWDQSDTSTPVYKIQASSSPLQCASWSPNEPQSMIVFGGYDRTLSVVDTRVEKHQCVVWSVDNAHDRPVTDAKFNTFIPYWLASAGEDSIVNIWDIRSSYHAPVAKIDGNVAVVTSVTWSSIRPENLATSASDGTMRFWSLYPESFPLWDTISRTSNYDNQDTLPIVRDREHNNIWCTKQQNYSNVESDSWTNIWEDDDDRAEPISTMTLVGSMGLGTWGRMETGFIYKGEEVVAPKGSAVAVKASKLRPSTYYSVSSGGQLVSHTIRFDTASNLRYRHRFDPKDKDKLAAEIEDDIYCRRITKAHEKLDVLKSQVKNDEHEESYRKEAVEFLQDCLQLRDPIKETEWRFDSIPDRSNDRSSRRLWNDNEVWEHAINTFKNDLTYWSYRVPPGYNTRFKFPLDFNEPIIAERLIEKEPIVRDIPPLEEEPDMDTSASIDNDLQMDPVLEEPDLTLPDDTKVADDTIRHEDHTVENNSNHNVEQKRNSIISYNNDRPISRRYELMDDEELAVSPPIKDRRNMSHIPSIVTTQKEDDSSINKLNLATPPYSAPGIQQNTGHSNNPFELTTINEPEQSPTSISSPQNMQPQEPVVSKNPFEETSKQDGSVSTNPFETTNNQNQNTENSNPFETTYLEPSTTPHHESSTNPFESSEDDSKSVKSLSRLDDNNGSRRNSWMSNKLGLSMTLQTDGRQHQDDANSTKSSKKRHKFNVFKKLTKSKNSSSSNEGQQQKQEERILQRQSSTRRNALHGPF